MTEELKNQIRKMILNGISDKAIMDDCAVSRTTIWRLKKGMPLATLPETDTGDDKIKLDNLAYLTKEEEKYLKKLDKEKWLYEDEEEGWVYHLTKADYRLKTSGLWWMAIAYPESVKDGWIEKLRSKGFRIAISPLHDKDKWNHDSPAVVNQRTGEIIPKGARYKAGDPKKPHWHIIIVSDQRMSYQDANHAIRECTNGPYVQKCRSLRNAFDYFLHINAPEKYQGYDREEIQVYNNFHIEPNKYETGLIQAEMCRIILEKNLDEMDAVVKAFMDIPEYMVILTAKPGIFTSLVRSLWKKNHPEGNIQRIKIVKDINE